MGATVAGIDVSIDRLDVHVMAAGEAWSVTRDAAGLEALAARLLPLAPRTLAASAAAFRKGHGRRPRG
jgi:transposase